MQVTIDRFEDKYAVCEQEDGSMVDIPRKKLPQGVKEGDILNVEGENITVSNKKTTERRKKIRDLTKDLWK